MSDHPAASDPFGPLSPIDFVDIGCSGGLDPKWAGLFPLIAFTVLGGTMYLLASRDNDTFKVTPQTSPESDSLQSSGKMKAVLGDIFLPIGVLAAATGLYAYFFYEPPASSMADNADSPWPAFSVIPTEGGAALSTGGRF